MKKYTILIICMLMALTINVHAQNNTFTQDFRLGSSGSDVANLQTWLISNGFDIPAISSGTANKGYFGPQTIAAVIKYQKYVGLPAYGFFGPMTRGYINGHSNPINDSFKITSPNDGEVWVKGTTQNITWNGPANVLAQKGDIKLEYPLPACAQPGQVIRCMIMVRAPLTIAKNVDLSSRSYSWNVGQVIDYSSCANVGVNPDGTRNPCDALATVASDGQYKIQICPADGTNCAENDSTFTLSSSTVATEGTPVINGVDAPTTLSVGQTGTWTVRATDPLNGTLSYSAIWGDSNILPQGMVGNTAQPTISQNTTFTHSYSNAGTYNITFTVTNGSGKSAQVSSTIVVTGSTSAGPLRIITPNGGDVWTIGTMQKITWSSPYYFMATSADLKLIRQFVCTTKVCSMIAYAPYTIATNIPINQNYYNWKTGFAYDYSNTLVPVPTGKYSVQICETGTNNCDSSDYTFNVIDSSPICPVGYTCTKIVQ